MKPIIRYSAALLVLVLCGHGHLFAAGGKPRPAKSFQVQALIPDDDQPEKPVKLEEFLEVKDFSNPLVLMFVVGPNHGEKQEASAEDSDAPDEATVSEAVNDDDTGEAESKDDAEAQGIQNADGIIKLARLLDIALGQKNAQSASGALVYVGKTPDPKLVKALKDAKLERLELTQFSGEGDPGYALSEDGPVTVRLSTGKEILFNEALTAKGLSNDEIDNTSKEILVEFLGLLN